MDYAALQRELQKAMYRIGRAHMSDFGPLTKLEAFLLGLLCRAPSEGGGMCVSELVRLCHGSPPAVSRALRQLEGKGYLERVTDRRDRRITRIVPTCAGRDALDKTWSDNQAFVSKVLEQMGEENVRSLIDQLNRLADLILEAEKERNPC